MAFEARKTHTVMVERFAGPETPLPPWTSLRTTQLSTGTSYLLWNERQQQWNTVRLGDYVVVNATGDAYVIPDQYFQENYEAVRANP